MTTTAKSMRMMPRRGFRLHLTAEGDVWLNTEVADHDGLVIGEGGGEVAINDAIGTLSQCLTTLKKMRVKLAAAERATPPEADADRG